MMTKFKMNRSKNLLSSVLVMSMFVAPNVMAEEEEQASLSASLTAGSAGIGLGLSGVTPWSISPNDQIQWRVGVSGSHWDFDKYDNVEISRIDYVGEEDNFEVRAGLDWYPNSEDWSENIFMSAGLMYVDYEFDADADNSRVYYVGNTLVDPNQVNSFNALIESSQVMPYLSFGWGNKITGEKGFDFQLEFGFRVLTGDVDVTTTADDPSNVISDSELAKENKQIERVVDGPLQGFANVAVSYHF